MADLIALANRLYALPPGEFTPERNRLAKAAEGDLADRVRSLRKPTTAAWAVNLLVRTDPELADQLLQVGAALRAASAKGSGRELVTLRRERRRVSAEIADRAAELAADEGAPLSSSVREQVATVLAAAMLDERVGQAVRTGLLVGMLDANGIDEVDVAPALAVPEALGLTPPSVGADAVTRRRGRMHVVPDEELARRARQEAKRRLAQAERQVADAERALSRADSSVGRQEAAALQANAEIDELQAQLEQAETKLEQINRRLTAATAARVEAQEALDEATAARDDAAADLAKNRS